MLKANSAPHMNGIIQNVSYPLDTSFDLDSLIDYIGDARFVLLREATHCTSEYYVWRALLSQRLIQDKNFSFIAVEGDWPDCYRVNRYIKGAERREFCPHTPI